MSRLARFAPGTICIVTAWLCTLTPASAQEITAQQAPAHISLVEGTAVLERDGAVETSPTSMPLLAGDRVRTRAGRVEVLFADGSTLHFDANTVVDFQSDEIVRLLEGRIRLNIPGPEREIAYRIDAPTGWVDVQTPGEYRVALVGGGREVELAVLRGVAELVSENGATEVRAGERAFVASGAAPSQPYVFNSAAWDDFDRWSEARRNQRLGISAQYLPPDVRPYAASLDYYGTWRHEPAYGYVWYPRVAVGWRPYYHGRWKHLRPFGWTWIGHDPWAWPTHHYGRWGFSGGVWFWIPGRHWGPAWVSWAYAPGYVSWCPLGFNNRPVFGFGIVNVFGGRRFDPWHAWTVVPHRRFGRGFVNVNVVNATRLDVRTRRAFAVRDAAPEFAGRAVPRAQAPIRLAGGRSGVAVPRGSATAIGSASPSSNAQTREAFRQRGSAGERLSGPGFPAPAREPRSVAVPRARERANPSDQPERGVAPRAVPRTADPGAAAAPGTGTPSRRAVPRGERTTSTPARGAGSGGEASGSGRSRAVPRADAPAANPSPNRGTPSRGVSPRGGGGSGEEAARRFQSPDAAAPSVERSRAVPRRSEPSGSPARIQPYPYLRTPSAAGAYGRSPSPGAERITTPSNGPDRAIRREPGRASEAPAPRGASPGPSPRMGAPDGAGVRTRGAARSSPAPAPAPAQRSMGSAPGPSRGGGHSAGAPSRPGGGGQSAGAPSRSRGGGQSTGRAVSRRGGGN